jgi:hypothetical protein
MIPDYKFAFVACCFIVAIFSYANCVCKKDWAWLVCGLGFTVLADFFLVMHDEHLLGVAAFCFTHVFYIFRATDFTKKMFFPFCIFIFIWATALAMKSVVILAAVYAVLFAINIFVNAKARRNKWNYSLVMAGLILFALCDVNVMLYNLQRYTNAAFEFSFSFTLIWVFYLPSQALLSVSATKSFKRPKLVN